MIEKCCDKCLARKICKNMKIVDEMISEINSCIDDCFSLSVEMSIHCKDIITKEDTK